MVEQMYLYIWKNVKQYIKVCIKWKVQFESRIDSRYINIDALGGAITSESTGKLIVST